jgi:uncharacterized protein (DUF488 family)
MRAAWTIGHGTRPIGDFLDVLREAGIDAVADVRASPGSRRHPQFNQQSLAETLEASNISYLHLPGLGGRREPRADSAHRALRVAAFRGYADHMASEEFIAEYERLTTLARRSSTAFMCAETLWWRCHRRLIADRLTVDGWAVTHLVSPGKSEPHALWDVARIQDGHLLYCGAEGEAAGRSRRRDAAL